MDLARGIGEMAIIGPPRRARVAERRADGGAIAALGFLLSQRRSRSSWLRAAAERAPAAFVAPIAATESDAAVAGSEQAAGASAPSRGITTEGGDN